MPEGLEDDLVEDPRAVASRILEVTHPARGKPEDGLTPTSLASVSAI